MPLGANWATRISEVPIIPLLSNSLRALYLWEVIFTRPLLLPSLSNRDLTWETSTMTDLGIDLSLFGCINITADWYRKITDGILMKLDIPNHIGMGAPFQNAGKVRNQGWELSVGYSKKLTRDFSLDAALTLSDVKNTITDMRGTSSTSGDIRNQEGSSINSITVDMRRFHQFTRRSGRNQMPTVPNSVQPYIPVT